MQTTRWTKKKIIYQYPFWRVPDSFGFVSSVVFNFFSPHGHPLLCHFFGPSSVSHHHGAQAMTEYGVTSNMFDLLSEDYQAAPKKAAPAPAGGAPAKKGQQPAAGQKGQPAASAAGQKGKPTAGQQGKPAATAGQKGKPTAGQQGKPAASNAGPRKDGTVYPSSLPTNLKAHHENLPTRRWISATATN